MSDNQHHDTGYKLLFSHAELVQQLLEGFAPTQLVELLDFSSLKLVNGSYVTPNMKQREDDVVWSVSMGESTLYLYILLEFQSTVDAAMPVRMMQYVSALYESLIKEKSINPNEGLPPVFPIVLYNGDTRWQVATNIGELITCPSVLKPYQPNMAYYLLDEGAYSEHQLNSVHNAVAAVFSLENATNYQSAVEAIDRMAQAIKQLPDKQRIDKAISYWIKRHLQRNLPEVIIPQTEQLLEDTSMLATNMQKWYHTAQTQGIELGLQKGKQEGERSKAMQIALNLLDLLDDATVALKTGLTLEEVKALKKEQTKA
jgi:predicted transposase/invertase (TIGR01784 family)